MEVRKFAAQITAKASLGILMFDAMHNMTIDAARDFAAIDYPDEQVVKVDVTNIRGPLPRWNPKTGELTELVDWVGYADVYLEAA